ncbi:glycosidase PH1107-related [Catenulispora acidiphila DSM 44928]|uniref:Glycosidase PH1107-related n=1 Tax=Catenulispora acidiphila (strain DSM 44928 / JCM 14897 / NBRC 102108 / NRRL B-24433 / ID139908) TaxID=479433 RepID=C7Q1V4_CATAD|nr:glycosidase PH1107-like protein [Catenulispora acidiphila]ACU75655.1 glycosidase PH1107-related [Catenulispora acidiphila DSM 44928]
MLMKRHPANPILRRNPDQPWEAGSVLNGTVVRGADGVIHMLYRATNGVEFSTAGEYVSSIGIADSTDGVRFIRRPEPLIVADQPYEHGLGCEDPRVVFLDGEYYIYYTAVEGVPPDIKVRIALATTPDLRAETVAKHGIVGPQGAPSKAATLFPEPVGGKYLWFFTWCSDTPGAAILHTTFDDLAAVKNPPRGHVAAAVDAYDDTAVLIPGDRAELAKKRVRRGPELGAPPIRTDAGWLFFYCNSDSEEEPEWQISAALLDLERPWQVIARTPAPLLTPQTEVELTGVVNRVTFPSGALVIDETVHLYYGSGDQGICLATCELDALLEHLQSFPVKEEGPCVG